MGRWRSGAFILSINLIWSCIAILISFSCLSMFSYNSLSFYKQLLWILSQTILRPPFLKDHLVEINYFPFCVILLMFLLALHWCLCCGIITSLSLYGLASSRKDLHQSACLEILETFLWMYKCYITLLSSREIKGCIPFPSIRVMLATQLFPRQCTKRQVYWMHTQFFSSFLLGKSQGWASPPNITETCWLLRVTLSFPLVQCTQILGHWLEAPLLHLPMKKNCQDYTSYSFVEPCQLLKAVCQFALSFYLQVLKLL